jgi:hypothetical protein
MGGPVSWVGEADLKPRPPRPERSTQATRSSYIRFAADLPNECWQSDVTHNPLVDATGTEMLWWLDDHPRCALSVTAHRR